MFQAQQHIAASEGSAARDFSQGIKKKRGERGRRERERERNVSFLPRAENTKAIFTARYKKP